MSSKLQLDARDNNQWWRHLVDAYEIEAGMALIAGKAVWSTPERLWGESWQWRKALYKSALPLPGKGNADLYSALPLPLPTFYDDSYDYFVVMSQTYDILLSFHGRFQFFSSSSVFVLVSFYLLFYFVARAVDNAGYPSAFERTRNRLVSLRYKVLYADDIWLLTPTVSELQNLLNTCERELQALDLVIFNIKKVVLPTNRSIQWCQLWALELSVWHIPAMDERGQTIRHLSRKFKTFQNLYRTF